VEAICSAVFAGRRVIGNSETPAITDDRANGEALQTEQEKTCPARCLMLSSGDADRQRRGMGSGENLSAKWGEQRFPD
jgi:hypothetical protein